ncbi:MAG: hypothetical protein ACJ72W_23730 [Actinoallomurus sp.]
MEPLPETRQALAEVRVDQDQAKLLASLVDLGNTARSIVPDCVGLSLSLVQDRLTFTLVASSVDMARLDAAQYLDGGPCVRDDGEDETIITHMDDPLDEERWTLFARSGAATGVASSLSLPVRRGDSVVGGINIYASSPDAFEGHVDALAAALGADASAAVNNADLSFLSRREAVQAPTRIRNRHDVDTALGILAARFDESVDEARSRLVGAAARAAISEVVVARLLIDLYAGD